MIENSFFPLNRNVPLILPLGCSEFFSELEIVHLRQNGKCPHQSSVD